MGPAAIVCCPPPAAPRAVLQEEVRVSSSCDMALSLVKVSLCVCGAACEVVARGCLICHMAAEAKGEWVCENAQDCQEVRVVGRDTSRRVTHISRMWFNHILRDVTSPGKFGGGKHLSRPSPCVRANAPRP